MKGVFYLLLLLGLVAAGCGGSDEPGSSTTAADDGCGDDEEASAAGRTEYTPDKGTATIKGVVQFAGKPPRRRPIDLGTEKFCVEHHKEPMLTETVLVDANGGLANVFIQVKSGLESWKFGRATGEVLLDQEGCRYVPHMQGMRTGQTVRVRNSDPIMHNVHAYLNNKEIFNWAQSKKGAESKKQIRRPGMIFVKCDVHGWMGSYIGVVRHPFFAVSGADGAFTIGKLPPGTYELEAWHEKLGTQKQTVTVADGATEETSFSFSKS